MNWKQHIFKAKWQNKNADIRLESVSTEQHPELIGSLLEIAGNDEDTPLLSRFQCPQTLQIVGGTNKGPLEIHLLMTSQQELPESHRCLDDSEHRFNRTLAFGVYLLSLFCGQFLLHCQHP